MLEKHAKFTGKIQEGATDPNITKIKKKLHNPSDVFFSKFKMVPKPLCTPKY